MKATCYPATLVLAALVLEVLFYVQIPNVVATNGVFVNPVSGIPVEFMMGVDLSEVPWILELGGKYYDEYGNERDVLDILGDYGINWVRLRVWNDPYDERGNPYGGGNCDLYRMTAFAAKAKAKGFKILVNFHYSDWWADPSKQYKPKAWANLSFPELVEAVYNWTYSALTYMKNNGALPNMVQVGNEINNGFLWPEGRVENWTQFVTLLKSAIRAIREVDPGIRVMIHLSGHREPDYYVNFFERLVGDGVDFDVIGLSFYTYWHGPLSKLREIVRSLVARFGKQVVLAEIAYAWSLEDADGHPNIFSSRDMEVRGGYKASVQGQATLIRDLIEVLVQEAGASAGGVFYWGAGWIPVPGAGWKTGEGNPWENQALFDFEGRALPSLRVFRLVRETREHVEVKPIELYDPRPLNVTAYVGVKPRLPESVLAVYTDHSIRPTSVDWGVVPVYTKPGIYSLVGRLAGTDIAVQAYITVKEAVYLEVPDPVGDDRGPGTYGYPSATVYKPGVFDIVKVVFTTLEDKVVVRVCFRDLGGNPWMGPNGFSLQYVHVYVRTTDPTVTRRIYRVDTFGLGLKLREDYGWQYALLISPGWGTEPLVQGELSALYYSTGEVYVEDRNFEVLALPGEGCIEARIPLELLKDWENLKYWKIVVAATSWAGEYPDRIRGFAPDGGEWLIDATAYADERARTRIIQGLLGGVIPKVMDILVYSEEYPAGITVEDQYDWLMGFDPERQEPAIVPPPLVPYIVITETVTFKVLETVTTEYTVTVTSEVYRTVTSEVYRVMEAIPTQVLAVSLVALGVGLVAGYLVSKRFGQK